MAMGKKGEAQRLRIIESATYCLTHFGERGATFQAIAEHCQMSQASVVKYLKARDKIFPTVLEHWLARSRELTEKSLTQVGTPEQKLRQYLRVSITIFFERPEINKLYLMLHYFAAIDERYRVMNSQIKEIAQKRIADILLSGVDEGSFKPVDVTAMAKTIHNSLVGYLLSTCTEIQKPSDLSLSKILEDSCLALVMK